MRLVRRSLDRDQQSLTGPHDRQTTVKLRLPACSSPARSIRKIMRMLDMGHDSAKFRCL